jgi:hypothetical protein
MIAITTSSSMSVKPRRGRTELNDIGDPISQALEEGKSRSRSRRQIDPAAGINFVSLAASWQVLLGEVLSARSGNQEITAGHLRLSQEIRELSENRSPASGFQATW